MRVERRDHEVSVVLDGELDLVTASRFREQLTDLEDDAPTLIVDLRELRFLDSSGIGELVAAQQRARRGQRRLVVVRGGDSAIAEVLRMTAVDPSLETADDPHAAAPPGTD
jgi:anti-sigma B factor antagonist